MLVNFRLRMMVTKKVVLLTNKISPLMVTFLFEFIIYFATIIYSVTTCSGLLWVVFPFNAEMLGPYIVLDIMASSIVTGNFLIGLDLIKFLNNFWEGCPYLAYISLDNLELLSLRLLYPDSISLTVWTKVK